MPFQNTITLSNTRAALFGAIIFSVGFFAVPGAKAADVLLFEDFQGITGFCGSCSDPQLFGVPTTDGSTDGNSKTIGDADNDWYGARFEQPQGGSIWQDVGVQQFGGGGNSSIVGLVEDDAGLIISIDTTGYQDITVEFDWRTFSAGSNDKFVVGYYVGDLMADVPGSQFDASSRSFNLQNTYFDPTYGADGSWNWNPTNGGGNQGDWVEIFRGDANNTFSHETFADLAGTGDGEVWLAFWLDNGEDDFAKFDNITVSATLIPIPASVWLFGSAIGLMGWMRRKTRQ